MKLRLKRLKTVTAVYEEKYADHEEFDRIMRDVAEILEQMEHAEVRRLITEDKVRPDGRKVDEIRPLDAVVDFVPRVHGSGLFTRGQTQALSILTLAPMGETQIIDGLDPEYKKRFMHHYNFPQYSVGETGRYGAPGRREIGHGALGSVPSSSLAKLGRIPICDSFGSRSFGIKRFFISSLYLCGNACPYGGWCANQGTSSRDCYGSDLRWK